MITSNIDLGQILIAALIAIVGWFIKKEITDFGRRLDRHEEVITAMTGTLARVVGEVGIIVKLVHINNGGNK